MQAKSLQKESIRGMSRCLIIFFSKTQPQTNFSKNTSPMVSQPPFSAIFEITTHFFRNLIKKKLNLDEFLVSKLCISKEMIKRFMQPRNKSELQIDQSATIESWKKEIIFLEELQRHSKQTNSNFGRQMMRQAHPNAANFFFPEENHHLALKD